MGGNNGGAMGPAGGGAMAPGNNNMGAGRQGSGPVPRNPGMQQIPPSGPMMRHQVSCLKTDLRFRFLNHPSIPDSYW